MDVGVGTDIARQTDRIGREIHATTETIIAIEVK